MYTSYCCLVAHVLSQRCRLPFTIIEDYCYSLVDGYKTINSLNLASYASRALTIKELSKFFCIPL